MKASILMRPRMLSYDRDWATAIASHYDDYEVVDVNGLAQEINGDVCIFLHSVTAQEPKIPSWVAAQVKDRKGKLVILTGNDYKNFQEKQLLGDTLEADVVGAIVPNPPYKIGKIKKVIHLPHALGLSIRHGEKEHKDRRLTVGFRGFKYPEELGDTERNDAVSAFMHKPDCDVRWGAFPHPDMYFTHLGDSKATVATEGGLPGMKAITSRHFDAVGTRTALIMTPGEYSGCLLEDHYIKLEPDLSNVDECLEMAEDPQAWGKVTAAAMEHCMENHTYPKRLEQLDAELW